MRARISASTALRIVLLSLVGALSGCLAPFPEITQTSPAPDMRPERFFAGHSEGRGRLTFRGRSPRAFHVTSEGRTESDGTFRLDQTVAFEDGETTQRTWRIRAVDERTYTGTLSDASGEMHGTIEGNLFHLRYLVRHPGIYMEQWLYLQSDGVSVDNRAEVTILGVPLARLEERIVQAPSGAR